MDTRTMNLENRILLREDKQKKSMANKPKMLAWKNMQSSVLCSQFFHEGAKAEFVVLYPGIQMDINY